MKRRQQTGRMPVRGLTLCLVFGAIVAGFVPRAAAQTEYEVKAVFLCKFAQYVEWPSTAFENESAPITLGILGDDPFGKAIDEASQGQTPHNRKFVIKRFRRVEELTPCHILFISRSEKKQLPQLLQNLDVPGTLIVGDTEQFARQGGMINFTVLSGRVRFEINPTAAKRAGLKISSQLLRLGDIVGG